MSNTNGVNPIDPDKVLKPAFEAVDRLREALDAANQMGDTRRAGLIMSALLHLVGKIDEMIDPRH